MSLSVWLFSGVEFQVDPGQAERRESAWTGSKPVLKQCWTQMGRPMEWVCMNRPSGGWNSRISDLPSPSSTAQINTHSQKTASAWGVVPVGLPWRHSQCFILTIAAGLAGCESMSYFYPGQIGAKPNSSDLMTNLKLETRRKNSAFCKHREVPVFRPAITGSQIEIIL